MADPSKHLDEDWMRKARVDRQALVLFTRQLAIMLGTGVPIVQALDTLSVQPEEPNFGEVIATLTLKISSGESFAAATTRFPRVFPKAYSTMVAIGERTGQMDDSLSRLADWMEADLATYQKVKGALTYPAFVFVLTLVLTAALFHSLIPSFVDVFEEMGTELPLITRVVLGISKAAQQPGVWLIIAAVMVGSYFALRETLRTEKGAILIAGWVLALPGLGPLLCLASNARFAAGMSALLDSGQDLPRSLTLAAETCQNPLVVRDCEVMADGIRMGSTLSEQMSFTLGTFPNFFGQMVAAGEEASDLGQMFERAANFCKSEVDYRLESLSSALEPIMLLMVGSVVGTIVISIFIPLYGTLNKF